MELCPDAFIVYQGHHGSEALSQVDVVLPGSAYTEKDALFFNTEGRPQKTRRALTPPGYAREDWFIVDALNDFINGGSEESSLSPKEELYGKLVREVPTAQSLNKISGKSSIRLDTNNLYMEDSVNQELSSDLIEASNVENFYATCDITRSSATMAKCSELLTNDFTSVDTVELNWQNYL